MIRYIKGALHHTVSGDIIVETPAGIGFRIYIPAGSAFYKVAEGEETAVYTSLQVKEDSLSLYGFADRDELEFFELLITVNGIGAKGAMSIMSALPGSQLRNAIAMGDAKAIQKANGIGKKTAERVILELKDKVGPADAPDSSEPAYIDEEESTDSRSEALAALISLGYTRSEASSVIGKIKGENLTVEDYIKLALRKL
ncbi:MAG: Holliday junction branch migration protein RuvA [Eubacterium sp.]|nr:Holliday junction branch migration protein RuvA [Eubacterium sp.]